MTTFYAVVTIGEGESVTLTNEVASDDAGKGHASTLSERDRRILDFEREWTRPAGAKDDAVRQEFGLTVTRYYQVLNTVIDSPAAIAYDPMLVRRLQRVRDTKARERMLLPPRGTEFSPFS